MIVVIGAVGTRGTMPDIRPDGLTAGIALGAAEAGASVEVVTRLGEDPEGDAVLLALSRARVGHVATLRDAAHGTPSRPEEPERLDPDADDEAGATVDPSSDRGDAPGLDAADVALALRYLDGYRVIVVVHAGDPGIVSEAAGAASWAGAHLVVVTSPDGLASGGPGSPADALLVAAPDDAEGVAGMLGRYAAAVDRGEGPAEAFVEVSSATASG